MKKRCKSDAKAMQMRYRRNQPGHVEFLSEEPFWWNVLRSLFRVFASFLAHSDELPIQERSLNIDNRSIPTNASGRLHFGLQFACTAKSAKRNVSASIKTGPPNQTLSLHKNIGLHLWIHQKFSAPPAWPNRLGKSMLIRFRFLLTKSNQATNQFACGSGASVNCLVDCLSPTGKRALLIWQINVYRLISLSTRPNGRVSHTVCVSSRSAKFRFQIA